MMFWRLVFWLAGWGADPWHHDPAMVVDLDSETVKALIAKAEANEERERGGMVAWTYSRDRVVERRELRIESTYQKAARLRKSANDKAREAARELRLVV